MSGRLAQFLPGALGPAFPSLDGRTLIDQGDARRNAEPLVALAASIYYPAPRDDTVLVGRALDLGFRLLPGTVINPPARRFWRMRNTVSPTSGRHTLTELRMAETAGGPNLFVGGTPIVSSTFSGSDAANAFDDNTGTNWVADTGDNLAWIGYRFVAPTLIQEIRWIANQIGAKTTSFVVESSDDGVTWAPAWTVAGIGQYPDSVTTEWAFPNPLRVPSTGNLYPFWRIRPTRTQAIGQRSSAAEAILSLSVGGGQAATGGFAIAGSTLTGISNRAAAAFDGSGATFWSSQDTSDGATGLTSAATWYGYAFPVPVAITEARLTNRNEAAGPGQSPLDFNIEASADGFNWQTLVRRVTEPTWAQGETRSYSISYVAVPGITLTATLSLLFGGPVTVPGVTLTATLTLVLPGVFGTTLTATVSLLPGTAQVVVPGIVLSSTILLVLVGGATAPGITLTATSSLVAGAAQVRARGTALVLPVVFIPSIFPFSATLPGTVLQVVQEIVAPSPAFRVRTSRRIPRTVLADMALTNPLYANATLTVYAVDDQFQRTDVLARLYMAETGPRLLPNPMRINNEGRNPWPIYVEQPVVAVLSRLAAVEAFGP